MADPRFFKRNEPATLSQLAELAGCTLSDETLASVAVKDVASLDLAGDGDITFFDNIKYKEQFLSTKAAACIAHEDMAQSTDKPLLLSKNPYKAYALIAQYFYPDARPESFVAASASIGEGASIGENCFIEEGAVIGQGTKIGNNCHIQSNAVIGENVEIGEGCKVGPNAVISHALIGANVHIYPGCCIGQDGFGFAIDPAGHVKVPQLGRVIIEDSVQIGANTTIDRGAGPDTVIGQGTWIDNLVQIGHNVKIGRGCVIVSQVGISGSTVLEDYVVLGGQVGIAGHLRVGMGAQLAAQSGVMRDVPAGEKYMGSPALPIKQKMRQIATLNKLIKKDKS